jgi:hypothetical protein
MIKILKYVCRFIITLCCSQIVLGMFIIIWDSSLITDLFCRIWCTLALLTFFSISILAYIAKVNPK